MEVLHIYLLYALDKNERNTGYATVQLYCVMTKSQESH